MLNRRQFLASILALGVAPAIVRASSIMRVRPLILPSGTTWYVSNTASVLGEDGLTWATAFKSLDKVMKVSGAGDTILVSNHHFEVPANEVLVFPDDRQFVVRDSLFTIK